MNLRLPDLFTEEVSTTCKQILYTNFLIGRNGFESNIVATCPDGTGRRNLIVDAVKAVWSPDGSQIAFLSTRTGTQQLAFGIFILISFSWSAFVSARFKYPESRSELNNSIKK